MALSTEVTRDISYRVRGGFETAEQIVQALCEELHAPGELSESEVAAAVQAQFAELHAQQQHWPAVTDCKRLDQAFSELRRQGILAIQSSGLTQSDGYDDFLYIYGGHPQRDNFQGYCFYTWEDVVGALEGHGLYLAFGPVNPRDEPTAGPAIGSRVVQALSKVGLSTQWDGRFNQRIHIPAFDWKRRREAE